MKYKDTNYKYISEEIASAFRKGFEEWEHELKYGYIKWQKTNIFTKIFWYFSKKNDKLGITEKKDCYEIKWYKIAKNNLWEPKCPEIVTNPDKRIPKDVPQAWSINIDDNFNLSNWKIDWFQLLKKSHIWIDYNKDNAKSANIYPTKVWMYNTLWAIEECKYRWLVLPTNEELLFVLNSINWNCIEKSKILKIPFVWYIDTDKKNTINNFWESIFLLSSSHFLNAGERCSRLSINEEVAVWEWFDCWHWWIVRPFFK